MQLEQEIKFWSRVDIPKLPNGLPDYNKCDMDACWHYDSISKYPSVKNPETGKPVTLNQFTLTFIKKVEIPDGKWGIHTCSNPKCVNPNHLIIGNNTDKNIFHIKNNADYVPHVVRHGEENYASKLKNEEVKQLCHEYVTTDITQRDLAKKFGVSKVTIKYHLDKNGIKTTRKKNNCS